MTTSTATDPRAVSTKCLRAWTTGDLETTRSLLADDVTFVGPLATTHGVDEYIEGIGHMAEIVEGAIEKKVIVDGEDVCIVYDLITTSAGTIPTAGWYHVHDGKIDSVRAFFDSRPFATARD